MTRKIEISYRTIVFVVLFIAFIWFLNLIRDVIFQIFIALLIMSILNPTVTKLQKFRVPRVASVLIVYFLVFGLVGMALGLIVPPLVVQTTSFANNLPKYLSELKLPMFMTEGFARELTTQVGKLPSHVLRISVSVFSNVFSALTVFIFALYFLLARDKLDGQLAVLFKNPEVEKKMTRIIDRLEIKLGGWARGEMILMAMVGSASYLGLIIIGVPYALPLAIVAGILEIVPNIGPILSAIPAILVGFSISPITGIAVAALNLLIQQVENYVFVPKVMEKSAGVSPIITLLSLVIGFRVAGVVGAILSVPVVIACQVLLEELVWNKAEG